MFAEFALKPDLISTWPEYRAIIGFFGMQNGRLISKFPKKWKRMVIEAAGRNSGEVEFTRIVESLSNLDSKLVAMSRPYDSEKVWLENAVTEHSRLPFHAILCDQDTPEISGAINMIAFDPASLPSEFNVGTSLHVCREAIAMANSIEMLLKNCTEVYFIDPHYDPKERRFNQPLCAFLDVVNSRNTAHPVKIQFHAGNKNPNSGEIETNLERWIKPKLLPAQEFKLVRWNFAELHNRYVLTDIGGVMFGNGLDENLNNPSEKEVVTILGEETRLQLLEDYSSASQSFNWLNQVITIRGD